MQMVEDGPGHSLGEPGKSQEILEGRRPQGLQGAVLPQQAGPTPGAEPGDALQGAARHVLAPHLPVVRDGEPVGLVAHPLEKKKGFGSPGDDHGVAAPGDEDLLERLGQGGHRDLVGQAQLGQDPDTDPQLSFAPVEQDELGRIGEAAATGDTFGVALPLFEEGGQPAGEDLLHGGVVVVAGHLPDPEPAVMGRAGQTVFQNDHGADVGRALDMTHVVTLDPQRGRR
jgi:hypothetical protein